MKVLLFSRYGSLGASSRVRCYQYLPLLRQAGMDVTVSPLLDNAYIEALYSGKGRPARPVLAAYLRRLAQMRRAAGYDLVWMEKELLPWFPAWAETLLSRQGVRYVVDYDDAVFHNYDLNSRPLVRRFLGKKIDRVMRSATTVITGNDYLAARAKQAGAGCIQYLPSVVDTRRYPVAPITENSVFTIGWMGTPVTSRYLPVVQSALEHVCRDGKARVLLVGAKQISMPNVPIEIRCWSEESETRDVQDFDVGIMPLMDEPWERGKCGYKLIQYMASGKPVIASPVGVNSQIVEDGVTGFHAATTDAWIEALTRLQNDAALRERMGRAGRAKAECEYSLEVTAPRLINILRDAAQV